MFLPKKVQPEANPEKQINDNNNDDEEHTEDEEYTETDDEEYTEMDDEEQPEDLETGSDPSLDFEWMRYYWAKFIVTNKWINE